MKFLGNLVNSVLGGFQGNNTMSGNLANEVIRRVQSNEGEGLAGLVKELSSKGLAQIVQSWIGTGPNKEDVSPGQLEQAIEPGMPQPLASGLGISPHEVATHLADVLPKIVDRLTPSGQMPSTISGLDPGKDSMES